MTNFDAHANLAVATVSPDSAVIGSTLGDSIIAESLEAADIFPAVPFNVTVWRDAAPEPGAAEIMRVTAFDGVKTFTVLRGQEGTAPLAFISIGWRFANTITAGDIDAIENAVNAEETARAAGDATLQSEVTAETAARTAADATLQSEVTAETAARIAGDASTLASSETYTDGKITTEAAARVAGDAATLSSAETYTDGEVAAEASTRAAADTTLQGHIDAEATARIAGDSATLTTAETYADAGDATTLAAAETYTDSKVVAAVHYRGAIDASTNPNLPAANLGDLYAISVAGTVSGIAVEAGDMAICKVNATPANTPANWDIVQTNINGAVTGPTSSTDQNFAQFNGASGRVIEDGGLSLDTDGTLASNSNARLASQRAAKTYVDTTVGAEATARASAVSAEATTRAAADTAEASARAAADTVLQGEVDAKQPIMTTTAVKNSAYTAGPNEIVPCDSTAAAFTVKLPDAPPDGTRQTVKMILSAAVVNNVTVQTQGADVFNRAGGGTTATLQILNQAQTYQYDHARGVWTVISDDEPLSSTDARYVRQGVGLAPNLAFVGAIDVQVFRASGTWTKPAGARLVEVISCGPGGGGGGGIIVGIGTVISGGAGGGGGGQCNISVLASDLPGTVAVVVGTGGAGGAAVTTGVGTGNAGAPGSGPTTFGTICSAAAGLGGGAGNNADSVGGVGGAAGTQTNPAGVNVTTKGAAGTNGGGCASGSPANGTTGANQATGGGAGCGMDVTGHGNNGGGGGPITVGQAMPQGGRAGTGGTGTVLRAGIGTTFWGIPQNVGGGGGGGGGNGANTPGGATAASDGGDGGLPGGGGGGGASALAGTSGKGGNGGDGLVIVITW